MEIRDIILGLVMVLVVSLGIAGNFAVEMGEFTHHVSSQKQCKSPDVWNDDAYNANDSSDPVYVLPEFDYIGFG